MPRPVPTDDATAVLGSLRRIVRFLRLADREAEAACEVSAAQLFVLHTLAAEPAASVHALAARTLTDPSSVSTVVARGLVQRTPSSSVAGAAFFAAAGITTQEDDPMAMTPEDRTALAKEIGREVAQALLSAPIGTSAADAPADLGWGLYRIQSELMRLRGLVEQALESKAAQP